MSSSTTWSTRPGDVDRVSICGCGAVTGYGWGHKLLIEGMLSGESAVRPTPGFSPYFDDDVQWVSRIQDGGDPSDGQSRFARAVRFAAREAIHDALDRGWRPGPTVGVVHGIVLGDVEMWADYHQAHGVGISKRAWLSLMPSTILSAINQEFDFHGPTMAVTAMCASGVAGLLTAKLWLDAGIASDVLMLTSDLSGTAENARAFVDVGVLVTDGPSLENCRPFQEGSRGFTGGEAAVGLVVSNRPAGSYATIRGGAMSHDGFHVISISPDRVQVTRAFDEALKNSGVAPEEIAYERTRTRNLSVRRRRGGDIG